MGGPETGFSLGGAARTSAPACRSSEARPLTNTIPGSLRSSSSGAWPQADRERESRRLLPPALPPAAAAAAAAASDASCGGDGHPSPSITLFPPALAAAAAAPSSIPPQWTRRSHSRGRASPGCSLSLEVSSAAGPTPTPMTMPCCSPSAGTSPAAAAVLTARPDGTPSSRIDCGCRRELPPPPTVREPRSSGPRSGQQLTVPSTRPAPPFPLPPSPLPAASSSPSAPSQRMSSSQANVLASSALPSGTKPSILGRPTPTIPLSLSESLASTLSSLPSPNTLTASLPAPAAAAANPAGSDGSGYEECPPESSEAASASGFRTPSSTKQSRT